MRGPARGPPEPRRVSRAGERGLPLLDERANPLEEVLGAGELVLYLRLQVELLVEVRVDHVVEGALRSRVRAGRPRGEPGSERLRLLEQPVIRVHPVDEAPLE